MLEKSLVLSSAVDDLFKQKVFSNIDLLNGLESMNNSIVSAYLKYHFFQLGYESQEYTSNFPIEKVGNEEHSITYVYFPHKLPAKGQSLTLLLSELKKSPFHLIFCPFSQNGKKVRRSLYSQISEDSFQDLPLTLKNYDRIAKLSKGNLVLN